MNLWIGSPYVYRKYRVSIHNFTGKMYKRYNDLNTFLNTDFFYAHTTLYK